MNSRHMHVLSCLPFVWGALGLMQEPEMVGGGVVNPGQAVATLKDGEGRTIAQAPVEGTRAPKLTQMGEPIFTVVTRSPYVAGFKPKNGPMRATVGHAIYTTDGGFQLKAKIVRHQTAVENNGNQKIGRGSYELVFGTEFARGSDQGGIEAVLGDGTAATAWKEGQLRMFTAWRDSQGIPKPILTETASTRGVELD